MQPQGPHRLLCLPLWLSLQFLGEREREREGGGGGGGEGGDTGWYIWFFHCALGDCQMGCKILLGRF